MDRLETEWWNKNGELIERVWGLPKEVCEALRRPYVSKASQFLASTGRAGVVVELGCGTGWFGRMLADCGHRVIGFDNSTTQIEIATTLAAEEGKSASCTYQLSDSVKALATVGPIQGVIIHCFLHHLYCDELEKLFRDLVEALPDGTPLLIVEPVYLSPFTPSARGNRAGVVLDAASGQIGQIREALERQNLLDIETQKRVEQLIAESEKNGFFFSPKEVPFFEEDLLGFLSRHSTLLEQFVCGVTDLEIAQIIGRVNNPELRKQLAERLIREFQAIDQEVVRDPDFRAAISDRYVFKGFWVSLKKPRSQ